MMITQTTKYTAVSALAVLATFLTAVAGEDKVVVEPAEAPSIAACDALKNIGKIYKDKENPYIQEFKIFGRYHYQVGSISGNDVNNDGFNDNFDLHRRARLGASVKFAQFFKAKFETQLVFDSRYKGGDLKWGIGDEKYNAFAFDQVWLSFDAQKAFDLNAVDKLSFTYGRQNFLIGAEVHTSSKKIKTVERSALANTVYNGALPVGFTVSGTKGSWKMNASIYSDVLANDKWDSVVGTWNGGEGYLVNLIKTFDNKDKLIIDAFYHNDTNETPEYSKKVGFDWFNNDWVGSVSYLGKRGQWGFMGDVIVGKHSDVLNHWLNNSDGLFYGFITQGTYSMFDDQVELVAQYQWQGSEKENGVHAYSKDFSSGGNRGHGGDVNKGFGDSHHLLYAGVNLYLCGDNSKVMLGVEYDNLNTPDGNADATTLWAAYRIYF